MKVKQYKGELLGSCLQLLLSLPNELVLCETDSLVPALQVCMCSFSRCFVILHSLLFFFFSFFFFQTTFKLGLSYLPLANAGLDALEEWGARLPLETLRPHFKHILPYFDDYFEDSQHYSRCIICAIM